MSTLIRIGWILGVSTLLQYNNCILLSLPAPAPSTLARRGGEEVGSFYRAICTKFHPCDRAKNLTCDVPRLRCVCAKHSNSRFVYMHDTKSGACLPELATEAAAYQICEKFIQTRTGNSEEGSAGEPEHFQDCRSHQECHQGKAGPFSRCNLVTCSCECATSSMEGKKIKEINGSCIVTKQHGEPCEVNEQCDTENNANCGDGHCKCETSHVWHPTRQRCVPSAKSCELDIQCNTEAAYGAYAKCDPGIKKCVCLEEARMRRDKCVRMKEMEIPSTVTPPPLPMVGVSLTESVGSQTDDKKLGIARPDSNSAPNSNAGFSSYTAIISIVCLCGFGFVFSIASDYWRGQRQKLTKEEQTAPLVPLALTFMSKSRPGKELARSDFTIGDDVLGKGKCGIVYTGSYGSDPVAVKTLKPHAQPSKYSGIYLDSMHREIELLTSLPEHEHIVKLLGYCYATPETDGWVATIPECYMLLELCALGSLQHFLTTSVYLEEPYILRIERDVKYCTQQDLLSFSHQIAVGMEFLGKHNIVHGDLASRNVLLTSERVVKLTDFGLAHTLEEEAPIYIQTTNDFVPWMWSPPEVLTHKKFSTQSDVWSYGVTLWEIFSKGGVPYKGMAWWEGFPYELYQGQHRMTKPVLASMDMYRLMKKCWQSEPSARILFADLKVQLERLKSPNGSETSKSSALDEIEVDEGYLVRIPN